MSARISGDLSPRSLINSHVQSSAEEQAPVLVASRQALEVPREPSDAKWEERDVTVETRRFGLGASSASFAAGEKEFAAMKEQTERDMVKILKASELSQDDRLVVMNAIRHAQSKDKLERALRATVRLMRVNIEIEAINGAMAELENDSKQRIAELKAELGKTDGASDKAASIAVGLLKIILFVTTGIPSA